MIRSPIVTTAPPESSYGATARGQSVARRGGESAASAVSWAAIAAGAFASAALGLILLALGAGAGLSSLSPWSNTGLHPRAVGVAALAFIVGVELVASALGGYLAGRLRTKWVDVHVHEVFFRDTAHGFLAWCVALVITAGFLTSAATVMVGGDSRPESARATAVTADASRYFEDQLFRTDRTPGPGDAAARAEVGPILAHGLAERSLLAPDRSYLASLVVARTGIDRPAAEQRVDDDFAQASAAATVAARTVAHSLYWLFVALLVGAFASSAAATLGGRQRDFAHAT